MTARIGRAVTDHARRRRRSWLDDVVGAPDISRTHGYTAASNRSTSMPSSVRSDREGTMRSRVARSFAFSLVVLLADAQAQESSKVTRAIEDLGNESPTVQARARKTILEEGQAAIDAVQRAINAPEGMAVEHLFALADDIGRERRSVRFTLSRDLKEKSWRVAWRKGGSQLAILHDYGGPVRMLDAELQPTEEQFAEKTAYFALDPTDASIAYNHRRGEVAIVERKTGRRVSIAVRDTPMLAYSPDGRHVAAGDYGRAVDLYSVADGSHVRQFKIEGTEGGLTPVFSPDGALLVVGNRNGQTYIFDVASGDRVHVLDRPSTQQPAFSPDGTLLAIGYVDGKVGIWNVAAGTLMKLLEGEGKEVFTVAWSPDGRILASAGLSGPIVIWSAKHLARLHRLDPGSERTFSLAFRPDAKVLVAAGNQTTRAWTIE